jgi:hypothetical protein
MDRPVAAAWALVGVEVGGCGVCDCDAFKGDVRCTVHLDNLLEDGADYGKARVRHVRPAGWDVPARLLSVMSEK